jgi:hypothetical protein
MNFEEILSGANGNFQEQNKVLESPIIIIIINAYYNYIINGQYSYYISNNSLLNECNMEENWEITGDDITSLCLPYLTNPMYTEQLREMVPPPSQNTVGAGSQIILSTFTILVLGWLPFLKSLIPLYKPLIFFILL